ncbi:S-layer homology domain-containing protein [Paenibacillus endophyticus]
MSKSNKRFISLLCAATLLLPALPISTAYASMSLNVTAYGANGSDELDDLAGIQAAIDGAEAGDTVVIPPGTYYISDTIESKSDIKLIGENRDTTIIKYTGDSVGYLISLNGRSHVEVAQLTLDGNGNANADGGIIADDTVSEGSGGHYLHHNRIMNMTRAEGFGPFGILIAHNDHAVITDNDFNDIGVDSMWGAGMRVGYDSNYPTILRNTIADTGRGGIFLNDGVEGAVVRNNVVSGSGHTDHGLSIELHTNVNHSLVEDNVVDHWLSVVRSEYNAIRRNTIQTAGDTVKGMGLEIMSNHSITTDNLVDGGQQVGMQQSPGTGYQYWGFNTIQNLVMWGMQLQGEGTGEIEQNQYFYKNTFQNTQTGHPSVAYPGYDGYAVRIHGNSRNITFDSNVIRDNGGKAIDITGAAGVDRISFINNTITGNAGPTIETYPEAAVDLEWSGNTVSGNGTDTQLESRGFADPKPTADFEAPFTAETGELVSFTNESMPNGGTIVENLWDFGDGLPTTDINPTHTYYEPGTYRVTLVVWSDLGRASLKEQVITISAPLDKEAPSAPTGLSVSSKSDTSISIAWTASTDNVGVTGYDILADGQLVGSTADAVAFTASGLSANTAYSFTVIAKDAAGNRSAPSAPLSVTTNGSSSPVETTPKIPPINPHPASYAVKNDELASSNGNGTVTVKVEKGIQDIILPVDASTRLGSNELELKWEQIAFTVPAEVLKQLAESVAAADRADSKIVLSVKELSKAEADALLAKANSSAHLSVKADGSIFDLTFALRKRDGQLSELSTFTSPIGIRLKTAQQQIGSKPGIYRIADDGSLSYVGGESINGELAGKTNHFSKYAVLTVSKNFTDVPDSHWAYDAIHELASKMMIQGTSDASFEPGREITRAEFTVMLVHALQAQLAEDDDVQPPSFTDEQKIGAWALKAVSQATQAGWINGFEDGSFRPQSAITRAEMAVIAAKALALQPAAEQAAPFADNDAIPQWAKEAAHNLASEGLIKGRLNGEFAPSAALTRAEAAAIIANLLNHSE